MLTAELVTVRRRGTSLRLVPIDSKMRQRAAELAAQFLEIAEHSVGRTRDEFDEACGAVAAAPRERRLADGLRKLVEDRCEFDAESAVDPIALRRELFLAATRARAAGQFDRTQLIATVAATHELPQDQLEQALFADLRSAHLLKSLQPISPAALVDHYDISQAQAVLLRAVRVVAEVECATPGAYRALFHKLKFLRLLFILTRRGSGYRIELDGPLSLFESVTKYGLQLALALPAIMACDRWALSADVRWGKARAPLRFDLAGASAGEHREPPRLADEVAAVLRDLESAGGPWRAQPSMEILDLPGVGLCIPDLELIHRDRGSRVFVELLGYWSRDAVWRRVELVRQGLPQPVIFALGAQLRVSEAVLDPKLPSALYVYKRTLSAVEILRRADRLADQACG